MQKQTSALNEIIGRLTYLPDTAADRLCVYCRKVREADCIATSTDGYIQVTEYHDGRKYTASQLCPNAASKEKGELEDLRLASVGFSQSYMDKPITSFDFSENRDALEVVSKWGDVRAGWLYFWGEPGRGKSHLAASLLHGLIKAGMDCTAITAPAMSELIMPADFNRSKHRPTDKETPEEIMQILRRRKILCIDDFGHERHTPVVAEFFFNLIKFRDENNLQTIFTSNYAPMQIAENARKANLNLKYEAMVSRITGQCRKVAGPDSGFPRAIVEMQGRDRR